MEKISVCITVLNEEKNIYSLLESLIKQTHKPYEIVIVDGGSNDKTLEFIKHFCKKYKYIKYIVEKGSIAHCRNVSIDIAEGDIIAITDAGCVPKKDWLRNLCYPFKYKDIGLVAGFYNMISENSLQKVASVYLGVPPARFDPKSFLPSARSVAFRKKVWEDVGGFDEKLEKGGEDTSFFYNSMKSGVKILRVKEARVDWVEIRQMNFKDIIGKFFVYAKGDGQVNIWWHPAKQLSSHNIKISLIFLRYLIGLILIIFVFSGKFPLSVFLFIVVIYLFWPVFKWRDVVGENKARLWFPLVQISSDLVVMWGFLKGLIGK